LQNDNLCSNLKYTFMIYSLFEQKFIRPPSE